MARTNVKVPKSSESLEYNQLAILKFCFKLIINELLQYVGIFTPTSSTRMLTIIAYKALADKYQIYIINFLNNLFSMNKMLCLMKQT